VQLQHYLSCSFGSIFLSLFIWLHVLYAFVWCCKLCIFIVMFMYSYCYVCSVLYILFSLCCSMNCLRENVYCTTASGCQTNCSSQLYHIIPYHIIVPVTNGTLILRPDELFCSLSLAVRLPWYQPSHYNCFHLKVIFKLVTANILHQQWKQLIITWRWIPLTQPQSEYVLSYKDFTLIKLIFWPMVVLVLFETSGRLAATRIRSLSWNPTHDTGVPKVAVV